MANSDDWQFIFTWHIENINMLRIRMDSPVFFIERLDNTRWYLRLEGFPIQDCFFLRRSYDADSDPVVEITLGAQLEILGAAANRVLSSSVVESRELDSNNYIRFPHSNLYSVLHGWRMNDMTLRCTVWGHRRPTSPSEPDDDTPFSGRPLTQEYYSVVDDGTFLSTACRPVRCSARTRIEVFRHSFPWWIRGLDLRCPNRVSSIRVESALRDLGSLSLSFHYGLLSGKPRFWVEMRRTVPDYTKKTFVKCYLTFVERKKNFPTESVREEHLFEGGADEDTWVLRFPEDGERWGCNWYQNVRQRDGGVELQVEIALSHEGCHHHIQNSPALNCNRMEDLLLQKDIQRMQSRDCDVTLLPSEGSVSAHQNILSFHSDVIGRTLFYAAEERKRNGEEEEETKHPCVSIQNDLVGIENLVKFMYGHPLKLTPQDAPKVLEATDVYHVPALLEQCLVYLKSNITPETAPRLLRLAYLFQKPVFFDRVKSFITRHRLEILHSEEWEDLMEENPSLALSVGNDVS